MASSLGRVRRHWERWGKDDPLYAVFTKEGTQGGGWDDAEFLASGRTLVEGLLGELDGLGVVVPAGPVLDFGCGAGRLSVPLAARFDDVHGVDISGPMIERARRLADGAGTTAAPTFHLNPAPDLAVLGDRRFALVVSLVVLQHMPARHALGYIREIVRVLAPGGVAILQIPDARRPAERLIDDRRLPSGLRNGLARLKGSIRRRPTMEMHPIPRLTVEAELAAAGTQVVAAIPDEMAGRLCTSYHYVVRRPG